MPYKWRVIVSVVGGSFLVVLDVTVVNVALPSIQRELGASIGQAQAVVSAYAMALGVIVPISGAIADRVGTKRLFIAALLGFGVGSLACAAAGSIEMLVAARVLQGVGGGMVTPMGAALVLGAFPENERGLGTGVFGAAMVVAPASGPLIGGVVVEIAAWQWIFLLNLPVVAVTAVLAAWLLRDDGVRTRHPFDLRGALLVALAFPTLLLATTLWTGTAPRALVAAITVIGLAALAALIHREIRTPHPVLALPMLANRNFRAAAVVTWLSAGAFVGAEFLLPLYLQTVRGFTPVQSGLVAIPLAVMFAVTAPLAGRAADRASPKPVILAGLVVLTVTMTLFSRLGAATPVVVIVVLVALRGVGFGLAKELIGAAAFRRVPAALLARGSSLFFSSAQLTQALGIAVLGGVAAAAVADPLGGIRLAYLLSAASAALALVAALWLPRTAAEIPVYPEGSDHRDRNVAEAERDR